MKLQAIKPEDAAEYAAPAVYEAVAHHSLSLEEVVSSASDHKRYQWD